MVYPGARLLWLAVVTCPGRFLGLLGWGGLGLQGRRRWQGVLVAEVGLTLSLGGMFLFRRFGLREAKLACQRRFSERGLIYRCVLQGQLFLSFLFSWARL